MKPYFEPPKDPLWPTEPLWFIHLNNLLWVGSNILVAYISLTLFVFVIGYFLLFDPNATTGGRLIFRFAVSIIFVVGLVFISVFIDPKKGQEWFNDPYDVVWWRPMVRFAAYAYVAFTITSLTVLLAIRKWSPHRVRTAPAEENTLVKIRTRPKKK